ncbi:FAD-dependent monooxygenase, partial [Acinetobacter baumannii]
AKKVIIIGAGPAGLFAALELILLGIKPIIIERGKDVKARRRDLAALNKEGIVNPDSNYCFGEGGAGTYSDGKLYTRSSKRGNIDKVL